MAESRAVTVKSFAKVNLDLRVLHRRADGYHEIRSLFHTISLYDRISLTHTAGRGFAVETQCRGTDIPQESNLAHKAALRFAEATGLRGKVEIRIEKCIPMGGGVGGGSSNAASVLLALPALTGKAMRAGALLEIAANLGSDVPFFLFGGAAIALGRGEELYPAPDFPALHGLLIATGIHVSTPEAYKALGRTDESDVSARIVREFSSQFVAAADLESRWKSGGLGINDFEAPVFSAYPTLKSWKQKLKRTGALHAMMSGSGSSLFGLYQDHHSAKHAAKTLTGADVRPFRLLSRRQYQQTWHRTLSPFSDNQWPPHPKSAQTRFRG